MSYAVKPDGTILLMDFVDDYMEVEIHMTGSDGKEIVYNQIPRRKRPIRTLNDDIFQKETR